MFRLIKLVFGAIAAFVLIAGGSIWLSLERAAKHAAEKHLDAKYLAWGDIDARPFLPAARVEKPMLKRGLLSAESVRFTLLPGAWTRRGKMAGPPSFDTWLLEVRLPRGAGCNCASILDGRFKLPPWPRWSAAGGRINVEAGALAFDAVEVEAERDGEKLVVHGIIDERTPGEVHLEGKVVNGAFEGTIRAGPLEAAPRSAILVDPARGRVIGGLISLEARVATEGSRITVRGSLTTDAIALETKAGAQTDVEDAIEGGHARIGIHFDEDVSRGADWAARIRESLAP